MLRDKTRGRKNDPGDCMRSLAGSGPGILGGAVTIRPLGFRRARSNFHDMIFLKGKFPPWIPVILWMTFIFWGSSDAMSAHHTFLIPLIKWLFPGVSPHLLGVIQHLIRKWWHVTEYAILGTLVWNALARPFVVKPAGWPWKTAGLTILICALYAASDEFHQSFVPSREASVVDVMIDICGSSTGLAAVWVFGLWRRARRWRRGCGMPVASDQGCVGGGQ